jgi:hypothetical protein
MLDVDNNFGCNNKSCSSFLVIPLYQVIQSASKCSPYKLRIGILEFHFLSYYFGRLGILELFQPPIIDYMRWELFAVTESYGLKVNLQCALLEH